MISMFRHHKNKVSNQRLVPSCHNALEERNSIMRNCIVFVLGFLFGIVPLELYRNQSNLQSILLEAAQRFQTVEDVSCDESATTAPSVFDTIAQDAYNLMLQSPPELERRQFDVKSWDQKTAGGLRKKDRVLLGKIYGAADSVFEYGLGESTYIANYVGVPRYSGVDSDPEYVAMVRKKVSKHYRFSLGDIGKTKRWGWPRKLLPKQIYSYQLAPLVAEPLPFDVYMVDGRFRFPCVIASFLHAAARGADRDHTTVLLHDCPRELPQVDQPGRRSLVDHPKRSSYHSGDKMLDLVAHSGEKLCVFKRKPETTDEDLLTLWMQEKNSLVR